MSFQSPSAPICLSVKILSPVLISGNSYSCTLRIYPQQINGATDNYTVSNVSPNFWVSNYSGGQSWKINSISNVNTELQTLDCVIEDVEYYNYSLDVTIGQHGPSDNINGYCFQLGDNGLPNLVPIYTNTFTISQTFISDLTARFNSRNYSTSYISVLQNGHSFVKGNFIGLNVSTGTYVLATSAITYLEIIGVVTSIGIPTVNYFTFRPFGQYLKASEIPTALTQGVGSIYYLDSSGNLTITNTYDSNPVYIQVSSGGDGILLKYRSPSLRTAYLNNIQGSTTTQSVSLFSSSVSPATISIGNTGGDTLTINPPVTSNGSVTLAANKTLTLNSTGGKVLSNVLTGTTTSSAMTIGESGDTSTVTINKDAVVATTKSLACDTFTGNNATTAISLFGTTTASNIALGAGQTTGSITLGHATPASDSGTLTINKLVSLPENKTITLNSTGGKVLSNVLTGTTTSSAMTIGESGDTSTLTINKDTVIASGKTLTLNATGGKVLTNVLTGTTTSSAMTIGESGDTSTVTINKDTVIASGKILTLNTTGGKVLSNVLTGTTTSSAMTIGESGDTSTVTINKDAVIASGKTLTLNSTGGKVLSNVLTGTTTSSAMTIGESGDTSTVTINKDAVVASGKTLTLNSTGGKVICNTLEGTAAGSAASLFGTTTSTIALGNASGGTVTINPSVSIATSKSLACDTFTGNNATTAISLFGTTTASSIALGAGQTTGGVIIGHTTPASDLGTLTINKNTTLASGKTLTLNSTGGKVLSNVLTGTTTSSAMTIGESGDTSTVTINKTLVCQNISSRDTGTNMDIFGNHLAQIAIGNSSNGNNLVVNQHLYMQNNKTITLNGTGKVICDTYEGTAAGSNIRLFSTTTGSFIIGNSSSTQPTQFYTSISFLGGKNLEITPTGSLTVETIRGSTFSNAVSLYLAQTGAISFGNNLGTGGGITFNDNITLPASRTITLNSTGGKVICNTLEGTAAGSAVSLFGTTTSTIALGNASGGTVTINPSVSVATSKSLACDTFTGNNATTAISLFGTTTASSIALGAGQTTGGVIIGHTTPASDLGTLTINKNTTLASGKTLTLNSTGGKVLSNVLTGTTTSSAMTIGESGDTSTVTINKDAVVATSKSLTCDTFTGNGATTAISLFGTTTASNIALGAGQTSGNITLGNATVASDLGTLTINKVVVLPANKTITLNATGGKVVCNTYEGTAVDSAISLFSTTTAGITLGGASSGIVMNGNLTMASTKNISLSGGGGISISTAGKISCYQYDSTSPVQGLELGGTNTTSSIYIGALQTTGNINLGHTTPASDSGTLTINKLVSLPANKTITLNSTGGSVLSPVFNSTSATQALTIGGSNTTASITIGGALTSGAINLGLIGQSGAINLNSDINIGTSAVNKGIVCNYLSNFNNSDLMRFAPILTTGNVRIGETQTTGGVTIGHTTPASDSGTLTINKNTTLAQSKNITLGNLGYIYSNNLNCVGSGDTVSLFASTTNGFVSIGNSMTNCDVRIGNITAASDLGTLNINKNVVVAESKSLKCDTFTGNNATTSISLFGTTTAANISIGSGLTSGNMNINNIATTGLTTIGGKVRLSKASTTREMWFNTGSGTTLFSSEALLNKQLSSNIYTAAPTEDFAIWEANALPTPGDASFIAQNGSTTIICNPADAIIYSMVGTINTPVNYSLFWIDEDDITTASNWTAFSGWKITIAGGISALSDVRTKHNIQTIYKDGILDKLENIDIVSFQKIRPPHVTRDTNKYDCVHRGYIAQDLQANGFDEVVTADESGTLSVNYSDMNLYWFSGVQKIIKHNKEQQKQIDEQKLLIDDLTVRLARLEQILGI